MSNALQKTYRLSQKLFPDINQVCCNCNTCCKTYGWLLDSEAEYFLAEGYPSAMINNNLSCIDSFKRDVNGKIIVIQIPRCKFYKKRRCLINSIKPLDCRLYPVKVKFNNKQTFIGLSLGCEYISSLSKTEDKIICNNIVEFFNKAPKEIIHSYLDLMHNVHLITQTKRFRMKKLLKVTKQNGLWRLDSLK